MDILFIHPNFPGQFQHLSEALCLEKGLTVTTLSASDRSTQHPTIGRHLEYPASLQRADTTQPLLKHFSACLDRGLEVHKFLLAEKLQGYEPEVIYIHPGWGDGLFLKELYPNTKIIGLFEFFYSAQGADVGFDPEFPLRFADLNRLRMQNTVHLHSLNGCDILISPTKWQRSRFPAIYQKEIQVLHEGINTDYFSPDNKISLHLDNGVILRKGDEVLTYVARGLEPYRGFHCFMRALPQILAIRPACQVLIVGEEKCHYGPGPKDAGSWKEKLVQELGVELDLSRVHFMGSLPYNDYVKVLQVSRLHIYMTYPFVLSWSMLEAMSTGCLLLASATLPVEEFIVNDKNGLLFPFFDQQELVRKATLALSNPERFTTLSRKARADIRKHLDFKRVILPKHLKLLKSLYPNQAKP